MAINPFYHLAPFIQEHIYREGWAELRPFQANAIEAILNTSNHILISTGTASGKTEAAFLPILTDLYNHPSATIGIIYIGPLKALINDQFERLHLLLQDSHIPLQSWHGDIAQSKKVRFLKEAQGVLQITPESLEALLINRHQDLGRLFGDLRYVIVDEVHAFIGSDRGRQIICQLQRLAHYQSQLPRRIGLSATIGQPEKTMEWLQGNTQTSVTLIEDTHGKRELGLGLEAFVRLPHDINALWEEAEVSQNAKDIESLEALQQSADELYLHLYQMTKAYKKTLVFANARGEVEQTTVNLRQLAEQEKLPSDIYHAHHGSISAVLREATEEAMRKSDYPACAIATVTLELGIDIGQLDQVLQIDAPFSVSSFVQRLGRSGRRDKPAQMFFYNREELPKPDDTLGRQIPWGLLQTIAVIQLYIEERWIEPPLIPRLPCSLLYHQTMSIVKANTELTPPELAQRILTLSPFQSVSIEQYRIFLRHLLEIRHLEQTEIGGLIIGLEGERVVNNYRFYATFEDDSVYQVREKSREIGTLQSPPAVDDRIGLAGFSWRVVEVNLEKKQIQVERVKGRVSTLWTGGGGVIHTRILQRMRDILRENNHYGFLQRRALERLKDIRELARKTGINQEQIIPLGGKRFLILPWCGTREFHTLQLMVDGSNGLKLMNTGYSPYYMEVTSTENTVESVRQVLRDLVKNPPRANLLVQPIIPYDLIRNKYDRFVPEELLRQSYEIDFLDITSAISAVKAIL